LRVVIDTNIFVSALISPAGPPFLVVQAWIGGLFELVTNEEQIAEVRRVSRYEKLRGEFAQYQAGELINDMRLSVFAGRIPRRHTCDDPDDAYLLDLADACDADYLVTGDHRSGLLQKKRIGRASILTAKAFTHRLSL
jgi:uncharacterized protein